VFVELNDRPPADEHAASQTTPRPSLFRRETISLADVAVQILSVVVGILLALFINNWETKRQQQATVDEAMHAIHAELAANRIVLRDHATQMFDMAKRMQASPSNKDQPARPCYAWDEWHGIGDLNLIDAAYQTSIATQALANMPFKQAQLVSQTYGWQRYVLKGVDLDASLLFEHPQTLDFCAGIVDEIGKSDLRLNTIYARLIGPDTSATSAPSAFH
jgi:type II secretory pathway pseudopilin PulG